MQKYITSVISNPAFLLYVAIGTTLLVVAALCLIWIRAADLIQLYRQDRVYLEITPPAQIKTSPQATEQLFHILHNFGSTKRFRHKVLRRTKRFSLEVVATKQDGVRYVIGVNKLDADSIERSIAGFLKDAKIKLISDPILPVNPYTKVKEFKQTKHYALSLRTLDTFEQYDPIAYILNAMDKLAEDEQISLQLVLSPAKVRNMAAIVQRYQEYYKVSDSTHSKAYSHLHRADLRIRVVAKDKAALKDRLANLESAITAFSVPKVQSLKARYNFPQLVRGRFREWAFYHRMPSLITRHSNVLSSLELANIYHFSDDHNSGVIRTLSKTLPAPLSLRKQPSFDVVLGRNHHHNITTDIGLTAAERPHHVYIIGGTGRGKTTMLEYMSVQDMQNDKGMAFIDPHGDTAQKLLQLIPEHRIKDVVYFNPADLGYPIGLNLLEIPEGLSEDELIEAKDFITESVISIMRKTFSGDDTGGHRIEYILRNSVQTALTVEGATIFTVFDLLTDPTYRKKIVATLEDERLKNFWRNEFGKAGAFQRVKMAAGVTAKIGRFQFSASAERMMSQPKSTINFDEILDGKILICNLSKGLIGEDTSQLFGISILTQLQLAAYRRARRSQAERKPFYLYVDEFQNFATPSFVQMMSESRKYGIHLTMAEQSTSQQDDHHTVNTILANLGTIICFRTGNPADEQLLLPLFKPYLEEGDIANLPSYKFYARMSAVISQEPVSGETILLEDTGSKEIGQQVIKSSRKNYATKYIKPESKRKTKQTSGTKQKVAAVERPSED